MGHRGRELPCVHHCGFPRQRLLLFLEDVRSLVTKLCGSDQTPSNALRDQRRREDRFQRVWMRLSEVHSWLAGGKTCVKTFRCHHGPLFRSCRLIDSSRFKSPITSFNARRDYLACDVKSASEMHGSWLALQSAQ